MTELEKYCTDILDNKIVACKRIKQVSEMLLDQLYNPKEFHFDIDIANRHIQFIEKFCYLPSGKLRQPFKLELFQKARLQAAFGFVDDNNNRQYNEVLIIEGRKNGKTSELAAIENDLLVNDGEGAPQIYNLATTKAQAALGFNAVHKMIKQSPLLSKHIRKGEDGLYFDYNMGYIKPLSSNTNSLDGLDAHAVIIDELAAIKDRDLYDLMKQSMGARIQPMLFCISTNGFVRDNIFDAQYDYACSILDKQIVNKRFLPFIYELDSPAEWDDESAWIKANPGIGTIKRFEYLRQMVQKAKDDPTFKPTVLVKDFNMKQNNVSRWLRWEELENKEMINVEDQNTFTYEDIAEGFKKKKFRYGIVGFDYAEVLDLAAAKIICKERDNDKIYVLQMYWTCEKTLEDYKTSNKDMYQLYNTWIERGLLRVCDGNKITKQAFFDWIYEIQREVDVYIFKGGYDRWHIEESDQKYLDSMYGKTSFEGVAMGTKTLSFPMQSLKKDLEANIIVYNNHPIDKWCLANLEVKTDTNGNIQPTKPGFGDASGKLKKNNKIDGALALIIAYTIYQKYKSDYETVI